MKRSRTVLRLQGDVRYPQVESDQAACARDDRSDGADKEPSANEPCSRRGDATAEKSWTDDQQRV
jgi:hypothetical protein